MDSVLSVTVPASDYLLVSLEYVKEELNLTDTTQDSKLMRWIAASSQRLAQACGVTFPAETVSETFRNVRDTHVLTLTRAPKDVPGSSRVLSITSVTADGSVLSAGNYSLNSASGLLYRLSSGSPTCWRNSSVVVVYRAGFSPIPADVSEAVMTLIRHRWSSSSVGRDPMLRSLQIEGVGREDYWVPSSSSSSSDLPLDLQPIADTIALYRRAAFA